MTTTLDQLVKVPTLEQLFERQMRGLKGVGWPRHTIGTGPGTVDCDGVPSVDADLVVSILIEGGLGVGQFQYSLDGGTTLSVILTIPDDGIYVMENTGCTLTFDDDGEALVGFQVGDEWRCNLSQNGFPITSWQPFSTPLTQVQIDTEALQAIFQLLYFLGTGGYLNSAQGTWLDLLAEQLFGELRRQGVATQGNVVITDHGQGPFTFQPGDLIVATVDGRRYQNTGVYTLNLNDSGSLQVQAEKTGVAYNASNDNIVVMVSTQAGVTVDNPDPGDGSGTWITRGGTDKETDGQLAQRLMAKWPARGYGVPSPNYDTWAKAASDAVTKTNSGRVDQVIAGRVNLIIAGSGGGVTPDVVAAVQAYINPRAPQGVTVVVASAVPFEIDIEGTAFVYAGNEFIAESQGQGNIAELISDAPIGGSVYWSALLDAMQKAPGMRNVDLTAPLVDVVLDATQVATFINNVNYVTV